MEAVENFPCFQAAVRRGSRGIVRIGAMKDDNSEMEYLWFEVVDMEPEGDRFQAQLLQEPCAVSGLRTGQVCSFTRYDVAGCQFVENGQAVQPESVWNLEP